MRHKIGDTFLYLVTLNGVAPGEFADYTPSCQIRSLTGDLWNTLTCTWVDPVVATQVQITTSDFSKWKAGQAQFDVQFKNAAGFVRSTDTVTFQVVQDVTQP